MYGILSFELTNYYVKQQVLRGKYQNISDPYVFLLGEI